MACPRSRKADRKNRETIATEGPSQADSRIETRNHPCYASAMIIPTLNLFFQV